MFVGKSLSFWSFSNFFLYFITFVFVRKHFINMCYFEVVNLDSMRFLAHSPQYTRFSFARHLSIRLMTDTFNNVTIPFCAQPVQFGMHPPRLVSSPESFIGFYFYASFIFSFLHPWIILVSTRSAYFRLSYLLNSWLYLPHLYIRFHCVCFSLSSISSFFFHSNKFKKIC